MSDSARYWRKCSVCGHGIQFGAIYQKCGVSTCRKSVYCSVNCWDVHVPVMNHKSAYSEEERAPTQQQFLNEQNTDGPRRKIVSVEKPSQRPQVNHTKNSNLPKDILIVASKLKNYIKEKSGMNTSGNVMDALSDIVRFEADKAIEKARREGRKTVMDRDFM